MAIKWGSTVVTAVKWGSTNCTKVYWGSTFVFPGGTITYNGSSFTSPLSGFYTTYPSTVNGSTKQNISSGVLKTAVYRTSSSLSEISSRWSTNEGNFNYTVNLSSYTSIRIAYTVTGTNNATGRVYGIYRKLNTYGGNLNISGTVSNNICTVNLSGAEYLTSAVYFGINYTHDFSNCATTATGTGTYSIITITEIIFVK